MIPRAVREGFLGIIRPLFHGLVRRRVHPNVITTLGFLVTVAAGVVFFTGHVRIAGSLVLLGGLFDILDGYRHELGSLPLVEAHEKFKTLSPDDQDFVLHLIAAHHGFARPDQQDLHDFAGQ